MDIKTISLDLFGQHVVVMLKEDSFSWKMYGKEVSGKLVGRIWGEKFLPGLTKKDKPFETVIAITIRSMKEDLELKSEDIEDIHLSV